MAVGQGALTGYNSYLIMGRETTLGTYNTCTAVMDFLSANISTKKETKILEQVEKFRSYSKRIGLSRVIEGEIEAYAYAESAGLVYALQNALGGTVTSSTATGETSGGLAFQHIVSLGNMDQSYPSMCLNVRYGDSSGGFVYQYSGVRVNELGFSAEIDEALKINSSVICMNSTKTANDLSALVTGSATNQPLSFVNGRVSVEGTFASLTSTSFWHVQSINFGISNNLKADNESRRIGSDTLQVLPPGIANFTLEMTLRFDTTTALDAMLNETQLSVEAEFQGSTLTGSAIKRGVKFQWPKVYVMSATEPEIGGPDNIFTSQITFAVLRDESAGYPMRAIVSNLTSSYA